MKLDPGIHIDMHSVLSLKPGVTDWDLEDRAVYDQVYDATPRNTIVTCDR